MGTLHSILNSSFRWPRGGPAGNPSYFHQHGPEGPLARMREAQRRMWPAARPDVPGLDYFAGSRTTEGPLSGAPSGPGIDYLDYFDMDGGHFGLAIGEVSGGEAPAEASAAGALLLTSLHALVRSLGAESSSGLSELVRSIHELFYEASPEGRYATLFVARYDPIERRLDFCNAGHEPPVLLRKVGPRRRTILLDHGGPMLGVLRRSTFRQGSLRLQPGDILAAYTSGLTEACDPGGEEWGYRRLIAAVENASDLPARAIVEHVFTQAHGFSAFGPSARDMTLWLGRLDEAVAVTPPLETAVEEPIGQTVLAA